MAEAVKQAGQGLLNSIPIVGNVLQGMTNFLTSKYNTDKTNQANRELAEYSYKKDRDMWELQNQYNSPSAQMARLKAAGLNPHLVYGGGGATTQAASMPNYQAPRMEYNYQAPVNPGMMLNQYQEMQARNAQIASLQSQKELTDARTVSENMNQGLKTLSFAHGLTKWDKDRLGLQLAREGYNYQLQALQLKNNLMATQNNEMLSRIPLNLAKTGLTYEQMFNTRVGSYKGLADLDMYKWKKQNYLVDWAYKNQQIGTSMSQEAINKANLVWLLMRNTKMEDTGMNLDKDNAIMRFIQDKGTKTWEVLKRMYNYKGNWWNR